MTSGDGAKDGCVESWSAVAMAVTMTSSLLDNDNFLRVAVTMAVAMSVAFAGSSDDRTDHCWTESAVAARVSSASVRRAAHESADYSDRDAWAA